MSCTQPAPSIAGCSAVVVTWQPDLDVLTALIDSLQSQGCTTLVVDNGSTNSAGVLSLASSAAPGVVVVSCNENGGLAAGFNTGLRWAEEQGCSHVFLFDQDSVIPTEFCHGMLAAWGRALERPGRLAALGPRLQNPVTGRQASFRRFRCWSRGDDLVAPGLYQADFLISSGSLLSLQALADIGLMKESYFIDNIDLEWCFRALSRGYSLYGTDLAILRHRIGESSSNPLVNRGLLVHHSPLRSYYSTRNRMHLWRQPYALLDWRVRDMVRFLLKSAWLVLFCAPRVQYGRQIIRGIRDTWSLQ